PPFSDDLERTVDAFDAREHFELLAHLRDAHRPRNRSAFRSGRQAASVPTLEARSERGSDLFVEIEALCEDVRDLARRAEVQLGGLLAARQYGQNGTQPVHARR